MNMRLLVILALLFLVVGCSPNVIRIDNAAEYQQEAKILDTAEQKVTEQQTQTTPSQNEIRANIKTTTSGSSTTSSSDKTNNIEYESIESGEEYTTNNCCTEGRLFIQTKKERSAYSESDLTNILITSYSEHCDELKEFVTQRVYLRYTNSNQDSSYLTFFKGIDYKKIQVDYKTISTSFEGCT
ncbi:MAG TPA: hypothetical protein VKE88_02895 [Candidatus Nanoarchaeia archaeon]|nr:hypothetical protein [Candidatus Nanoarchaeia archaeon]